jgi:VWFA-related protein
MKMMAKISLVAVGVGCVGVGAIGLWGREAERGADRQEPAIKSEVRIVVVDVVVTGAKGVPAAGLKKEDFVVAEDGKAQVVSFFEEHTGGKVSPIALPAMPPDVFTNYPTVKTTDSVNVLLLDSLNTMPVDQSYVRPQMEKYMEAAIAAPNGARLAIFTLGQELRMVRGFTTDANGLKNGLMDPKSHTEAKYEPQLATPFRKKSEEIACAKIRSPAGRAACQSFMAEENGERNADRVAMTLQAFQALARYLAPIPGRKNVMWVAGSFPIQFFPDTGKRGKFASPYPSAVRQTAELLTADQVAVYPIGASGLSGETYLEGGSDPSANKAGKAVAGDEADRAFNQIAMELLARDTGGHAFYNTNGLSEAMAEAVDEGSHFYTLAYAPTNTHMDGKYRKVEVKDADGNFKLAYRRGYYAENAKFTTESEAKKRDELAPLMGFGMPDFAQVLYKVRVAPMDGAGDGAKSGGGQAVRYGFDFAITPGDLRLQSGADGLRHGNMEVMLIAYDGDGRVLNSFRKKSEIALDKQGYAEVTRVGLQMHPEMDVPAEAEYVRMGIMDLESGKVGSLVVGVKKD